MKTKTFKEHFQDRPIKELLQYVLQNVELVAEAGGLCETIEVLHDRMLITSHELLKIQLFMQENSFYGKNTNDYWWPFGEVLPRRAWLKKQISEL